MSGSTVERHLARLRLTFCEGIGESAMQRIESASGVALDNGARTFLRAVGRCRSNLRVISGPAAGHDVVFLGESEILSYVEEDLTGGDLIPFATSLFGDLFCLRGGDGGDAVLLLDLTDETATVVAGAFDEFLHQLASRNGGTAAGESGRSSGRQPGDGDEAAR